MAKRGRPKGSRNKVTNQAKEAILMAYERIGGADRLVEWILADKTNEAIYWGRIFPRLLPRATIEPVEAPEAPAPVTGALVWQTPAWAKKAQREHARRLAQEGSVASVAAAVEAERMRIAREESG